MGRLTHDWKALGDSRVPQKGSPTSEGHQERPPWAEAAQGQRAPRGGPGLYLAASGPLCAFCVNSPA